MIALLKDLEAGLEAGSQRRSRQLRGPAAFGVVVVGILAITSPLLGPPVLYVDDDATGANDGLSWEDAYTDLQDALDQAVASGGSVTEVWVAKGTYRPTELTDSEDPRSATFQLLDGVGLYGGFAGRETQRDQCGPTGNETVAPPVVNEASFGTPRDPLSSRQNVHKLDFPRQGRLDLGRTSVPPATHQEYRYVLDQVERNRPHHSCHLLRYSPGAVGDPCRSRGWARR